MIRDPVNQKPHAGKSDQERNRGNKHALPRPVGDGGADQVTQPRQLQQHQQHNDDQADERKQERGAAFRHTLLNHRTQHGPDSAGASLRAATRYHIHCHTRALTPW